MKTAYFINTFKSINWGAQAMSSSIHYMIHQTYPDAEFVPLTLPDLPYKKIKIFRKYYEYKLVQSIKSIRINIFLQQLKLMILK